MYAVTPDVSVVICAYTEKRWSDLLSAIESVRRQLTRPKEIIVVIDYNARLAERLRQLDNDVVVLENSQHRGLSGARNTGVEAATGDVVAFLDDDAVAEPDWLGELRAHFDDPDVLGVGGMVQPLWSGQQPRWLPREFYWVVGCAYHGLPEVAGPIRNPIGASMMIRRDVVRRVGGFRTGIGRAGADFMGCEETELCIQARRVWPGGRFMFEPRARVHHRVPADRAQWAYFRARCYAEGRSKALVSRLVGAEAALGAERRYTFKILPWATVRGLFDVARHRDLAGLARSGAIVSGLAITTAGYLVGVLSGRSASLTGHDAAVETSAHHR